MRILRRQLMDLLDEAQHQQELETPPPRLRAALLHDSLKLLPHPDSAASKERIVLQSRTISHGSLHRHLITIRCPDQAFYLNAIKGYLQRSNIQPINQQTMVATMQCDEEYCDVYLRHPDQQSDDNFMFIALHLSATLVPDSETVCQNISAILRAVDLSICDFEPMQEIVPKLSDNIRPDHPCSADLLTWMNEGRYLFFGLQMGSRRLGILRDYRAMSRVAAGLHQEIDSQPEPTAHGLQWLHLAASPPYRYSAAHENALRICWRREQGSL